MIEIIKEPVPVETVDEIPRNVRQIGKVQGNNRVYVEDYVYRFLHGAAREKRRYAFILLGEVRGAEETVFIKGALELEKISFGGGIPVFSDDVWDDIYRQVRRFFPQWKILGWAMQCLGEAPGMDEIQRICSRHFPGNHGNVLLYDAYGEWERIYGERSGITEERGGFLVYYEKNGPMSAYLSAYHGKKETEERGKRKEREEEADLFLLQDEKRFEGEIRQDREAMARYRSYINENNARQRGQVSKAVVSIAVVVMLVLSGVLVQNYAKLNEMQKTVAAMGDSQEKEQEEMIQETIKIGAEEMAQAGTTANMSGDAATETKEAENGEVSQNTEAAAGGDGTVSASADGTQINSYLQQGYYIVEKGDKLTDISRKVYGTEDMVQQICEKNQIENGDHICAGDKLLLP